MVSGIIRQYWGFCFYRVAAWFNKSFIDWGEVFGDQAIATAILDRLLHHSTTLNIKGGSYRLKEKRKSGLLTSPPDATKP